MINRDNYLTARDFISYLQDVRQLDAQSCRMYWQGLKHLLQWLDARPLADAPTLLPSFPEYLLTARNKRHPQEKSEGKRLTPKYMKKILGELRYFFKWARMHAGYGSKIPEAWIDTLRIRRSADEQSRLKEREYWRLEDVRKIANLKPRSLRETRDIAATVFLFLSAMRVGAFTTLPLECVQLEKRRVMQLPEKGVQTKNSKAAITFLLPLPDLLKTVEAWVDYLSLQGGDLLFYPPLNQLGTKVMKGLIPIENQYNGRKSAYSQGLKQLCDRAGVAYKSPHKIRHGFGVYGVKNSKDIAQLKAISQNMMHANLGITDGIYGVLAEDDLSNILGSFGQ